MEEEELNGPFLSADETMISMLRVCFMSGQVSPGILHKATGVDIDLCIEFCSHSFAEMLCNPPPEERT